MIWLVHHGEAVPADVDAQRPLTEAGLGAVERLALETARRGAAPVEVWHSGKLRARQTGEAFRRVCNPRAAFTMVRGLRPADPSDILADRLAGETRELLLVGHMPLIARLLRRLVGRVGEDLAFPANGLVALEPDPAGDATRWREMWRLDPND